ncbi:hypothetical protein pb186bvf_007225 [Paramecium bursaria]
MTNFEENMMKNLMRYHIFHVSVSLRIHQCLVYIFLCYQFILSNYIQIYYNSEFWELSILFHDVEHPQVTKNKNIVI